MISGLYKVNEEEKYIDVLKNGYKILPLSSTYNDGNVSDGYSFNKVKSISVGNKEIEKVYSVNGKIYLFLSDKKIYVFKNNRLELFSRTKYNEPPMIFGGRFKGKKALYLCSGGYALIYNGAIGQYLLPCGKEYVFYKNKLCISVKNNLLISGENLTDKSDYTVLYLGKNSGEIVKLYVCNGYLYALCENTLKKFSLSGEITDFTVDTKTPFPIRPEENSVAVIGENCYYLSDGKIFAIEDGKVIVKGKLLESENYVIAGGANAIGENYVLPVMVDGENFVYVYDGKNGNEQLVKESGMYFSENLAVKSDGIYVLGKVLTERGFIIKGINFGNGKVKGITGLSGEFSHPFKIKIDGEFGDREFFIQSGRKKEKFYFPTKEFTLTATSNNERISVKNLRLYYREIKE